MSRDPGHEGNQRRLIDVTGPQVFGTSEVIEFVAKNSVAIRDQEVEEELRGGENQNDCRAARITIIDLISASRMTKLQGTAI
jgi:hypothetical protein